MLGHYGEELNPICYGPSDRLKRAWEIILDCIVNGTDLKGKTDLLMKDYTDYTDLKKRKEQGGLDSRFATLKLEKKLLICSWMMSLSRDSTATSYEQGDYYKQ